MGVQHPERRADTYGVKQRLLPVTIAVLAATVLPLAVFSPALAAPHVKISAVYFDPGPGPDPASQLNLEYVVIRNNGAHAVRLRGWRLHDIPRAGTVNTYHFPKFRLRPGKTVRIHTGKGHRTKTDLYWGLSYYVWGDDSDKATLENRRGNVMSTCRWVSTDSSPKFC